MYKSNENKEKTLAILLCKVYIMYKLIILVKGDDFSINARIVPFLVKLIAFTTNIIIWRFTPWIKSIRR